MAEYKERKRREQIGRNARAFLALPKAEQTRQLMAMIDVRVELKKPGDEPPAEEPAQE